MMTRSAPCLLEIAPPRHRNGRAPRCGSPGSAAVAWITMAPASKPFGMATISSFAPRDVRRAPARPRSTALPAITLDAALRRARRSGRRRPRSRRRARPLAAGPAPTMPPTRPKPTRTMWPARPVTAARLAAAAASGAAAGRCRRQAGRPARNSSGLSRIERIAPVTMRSRPSSGSRPTSTPSAARMKENSPICARLAAISSRGAGAGGGTP